ncbi:unnamed protein product, partial [Mesorhabditis belari]|uniref:Uncharacterized protein n=1 Tax=Mesorhabditis belari TaxID=2138241 RepID=A0AAF3ESB4_9BILA
MIPATPEEISYGVYLDSQHKLCYVNCAPAPAKKRRQQKKEESTQSVETIKKEKERKSFLSRLLKKLRH